MLCCVVLCYSQAILAAVIGPWCETEAMTRLMRWTVQSYAIRQGWSKPKTKKV